ncbi:MAG: hypothetical protein WAM60_01620 [Candidatus Promineifilaceae bacterium]
MRKVLILSGVVLVFFVGIANQFTPKSIQANSLDFTDYLPVMITTTGDDPGDSPTFLESFDGDPASPLPWRQVDGFTNWDVSVHRRSTELTMQGINAQHGTDCGPPPDNTHYNDTYEGAVYQCKNHVMTAVNDSGYGAIYLTPNQLLDFSNGHEAVVRFDMSTLKTSTRDWITIWITPFEDNLQIPIDFEVDMQGSPDNTVQILLSNEQVFLPRIVRNGVTTDYHYEPGVNWWTGYEQFLEPSAQRRDTFELRISQTHLKFCMPDYDFCWIDMDIDQPLTWNQGIIQFGHASYNPTKDGAGTPNTWHWDNFEIQNSIPFTIIKGNRRYVNANNPTIQFYSPAPSNAYLRFTAIGDNIEVSFNNGGSWEDAQKNPQGNDDYHFSSYFTPIPQGTTSVKIRGDGWGLNNEAWQARDLTIWSKVATSDVTKDFESKISYTAPDKLFTGPSEEKYCSIPND